MVVNLDIGTGISLAQPSISLTQTTEVIIGIKALDKLLGPSCDYLGDSLGKSVECVIRNLQDIFGNAIRLVGSKIDEEGGINPRVLKPIVNDGGFCEDKLAKCYYGGILASSRTKNRADDRGIPFVNVLSSMSIYQIRTHYIFYTCIKHLCDGKGYIVNLKKDREKMSIFLPDNVYLKAMNFSNNEDVTIILPHTITGLIRLGLIDSCTYGTKEMIKHHYPLVGTDGIYFTPSSFGIELYLWAHGRSDVPIGSFLINEIKIPKSEFVDIPSGSISVNSDFKEQIEHEDRINFLKRMDDLSNESRFHL
jgi:hypothetical protein